MTLVSKIEIAEQLRVTPSCVSNWEVRYKGWPKPKQVNRRTKLYDAMEVSNFLQTHNLPDDTKTLRGQKR